MHLGHRLSLLTLALSGFLFSHSSYAEDWPQWRGPQRNGQSRERDVLAAWPEKEKPQVLWRAQVGKGHSAVSVADGLAYTLGWDGQTDTVFCFDAATGKEVWKQSYPCATLVRWPGPRGTPTVIGGVVYTLGQHGQLRAWDAKTGTPRWSVDLAESYHPDPDYGFPWSPLIEGDLLILSGGSRGLALHTKDGTPAWGADEKPGACASPVPFDLDGKHGVAIVTMNEARDSTTFVGLDPQTGALLWQSAPWPEKYGAVCNDLLVADGSVFVASAETYNRGARFRIVGDKLETVWDSPKLSTYTGNAVLVGEHLFNVSKAGLLRCLDWKTGEEIWSERGFGGFGTVSAADGKIFILASSKGRLTVIDAAAPAFKELRKFDPFTGKGETFTSPTLANGRLYCRSYEGEVVCLQIGATSANAPVSKANAAKVAKPPGKPWAFIAVPAAVVLAGLGWFFARRSSSAPK
jgi:outer membrane protein assembly factor BamB